jgi:hypothetical protein
MNDPNNRFVANDQKVAQTKLHDCPICGHRHAGLVSDPGTEVQDDETKNRFDRHDARVRAKRRGEIE